MRLVGGVAFGFALARWLRAALALVRWLHAKTRPARSLGSSRDCYHRRQAEGGHVPTFPLADLGVDLLMEIGRAYVLGEAALLSKLTQVCTSWQALTRQGWSRLTIPVPRVVCTLLLDVDSRGLSSRGIVECARRPVQHRIAELRVAGLERLAGKSLAELGLSRICAECQKVTRGGSQSMRSPIRMRLTRQWIRALCLRPRAFLSGKRRAANASSGR